MNWITFATSNRNVFQFNLNSDANMRTPRTANLLYIPNIQQFIHILIHLLHLSEALLINSIGFWLLATSSVLMLLLLMCYLLLRCRFIKQMYFVFQRSHMSKGNQLHWFAINFQHFVSSILCDFVAQQLLIGLSNKLPGNLTKGSCSISTTCSLSFHFSRTNIVINRKQTWKSNLKLCRK